MGWGEVRTPAAMTCPTDDQPCNCGLSMKCDRYGVVDRAAVGGLRPAADPPIRLGGRPDAPGDPAEWSRHSAVSAEEVARLRAQLAATQAALVEARNTLAVRTGELRTANHKLALIHQAMSSVYE